MFLLKISGVAIKPPPLSGGGFTISKYNLTKAGRVISGKMTMDLVAKKRKFFFNYPEISGPDMDKILGLIDGNNMFFALEYEENNRIKQATVYVGEIGQDYFRTRSKTTNTWYWKNFTFNLIER